jgi:hypothetical protein
MRTVEETLEIVFAAMRDVSAPLGMNQRIMDRLSYWRSLRCRPPVGHQIRKVEPISSRLRKPEAKR